MKNSSLRLAIALLPPLATAALTSTAEAQGCKSTWCGWTAYWENDSFTTTNGSDELYTNGLRFTLGRTKSPGWTDSLGTWWRQHSIIARDREHDSFTSYTLGQNFFTPREITTYDAIPNDRPFAGLLYAGMRVDFTEAPPPEDRRFLALTFQHSFEVGAGVFGQTAFGGELQTAFHVLRKSRIPKGWDNQVRNQPALFGTYMWRAKTNWSLINIVPHAGIMLGNPQTYAYGGATVGFGYHMDGFPTVLLQQNAARGTKSNYDFEIGLIAGVEGRQFLRNEVVEGSGRNGVPQLRARAGVVDQRLGLTARLAEWRLSWSFLIHRSAEARRYCGNRTRHTQLWLAFSELRGPSIPKPWCAASRH